MNNNSEIDYVKQIEEENYKMRIRIEDLEFELDTLMLKQTECDKKIYSLEDNISRLQKELTQKENSVRILNETIKYHTPRN
jgi:peptidoglycan hydrolase CwlO-like protein